MKFKDFKNIKINEMARKKDLEYQTTTKKGTPTEDLDKVEKVIVTLKGKKSEIATKLAKRLDEIRIAKKELDNEEKELKQQAKGAIEELFDAKDEIWTRIVQTASLALAMSKATERKSVQIESFVDALIKQFPELEKQIKELKEQYTKVSKVASKVTVEGIGDLAKGIVDKIKNIGKTFLNKVKDWGKKYDDKLQSIEKGFLKAINESAKKSFSGFVNLKEYNKEEIKSEEKENEKNKFFNYVNKLDEESREVSGNLIKNLIDLIHDYINSEYKISDDEKDEIINNMKIKLDSHNRGVWKKGPKFIATSHFIKDDDDEKNIQISVEIITDKF